MINKLIYLNAIFLCLGCDPNIDSPEDPKKPKEPTEEKPLTFEIKNVPLKGAGSEFISKIHINEAGKIIFAGRFINEIQFKNDAPLVATGGSDGIVSVISNDMAFQEIRKQIDGLNIISPSALAINANGDLYTMGSFHKNARFSGAIVLNSDGNKFSMFLAKYDKTGVLVYAKKYDSQDVRPKEIIADKGYLYAGGDFSNNLKLEESLGGMHTLIADYRAVFVTRFDEHGTIDWSEKIDGEGNDFMATIDLDDKQLLVAGSFSRDLNFGSHKTMTSKGSYDGYILSMRKESGGIHWYKQITSTSEVRVSDLKIVGNAFVVSGIFKKGTVDFGGKTLTGNATHNVFVAKYDDKGHILWCKSFETVRAIAYNHLVDTDENNNIYLTGAFTKEIKIGETLLKATDGYDDIYLTKLNPKGEVLFVKHIGGKNIERISDIFVVRENEFYLAGHFYGTLTIDTIDLKSQDDSADIFILRFKEKK